MKKVLSYVYIVGLNLLAVLLPVTLLAIGSMAYVGACLYHNVVSQSTFSLGLVVVSLYLWSAILCPGSLLMMRLGSDRVCQYTETYLNRSRL